MAIFPTFFLRQYRPGNCLLRYSRPKKNCLGYKKKKLNKSKNWHFSKGVEPWFWSKNDHFFNIVFLGNIGQANVFCDILERKNAFRGYRNKKLKKSKNWDFSKRVNPWFCPKMANFPTFFLIQYRPGKYLLPYSRAKKRLSRL